MKTLAALLLGAVSVHASSIQAPPLMAVKAVSANSYTLLSADLNQYLYFTGTSTAVSVPTAGGSAGFPNGWHVWVSFNGTGTAVFTPVSGTIDGAATASVVAGAGNGFFLTTNGTNWFTTRGFPTGFVQGAANLTTANAVPVVSPAGVLTQDQTVGKEFCWNLTNHNLGVGTCTPATDLQIEAAVSDGINYADIGATSYGTVPGGTIHGRLARGTRSVPTAVQSGDVVGGFGARAYDGTVFQTSSPAAIHMIAEQNQAPGAYGMYMTFLTTPNGSSSRVNRLRIDGSGFFRFGADGTPTFPYEFDDSINNLAAGQPTILLYGQQNKERIEIDSLGNGSAPSPVYQGVGARGTVAAPTATQTDDMLVVLGGAGYDNAGTPAKTSNKGIHSIRAAENWTTAAQGTYWQLELTPIGSTTRAVQMTVTPTLATFNMNIKYAGTNSTGAGTALLGANSPATTLTAPYKWFQMQASDGTVVYVPAWK